MRVFKHQGSGAMVVVDNHGKKTIKKYGVVFHSFLELRNFEMWYQKIDKKRLSAYDGDVSKLRDSWYRAKGEI